MFPASAPGRPTTAARASRHAGGVQVRALRRLGPICQRQHRSGRVAGMGSIAGKEVILPTAAGSDAWAGSKRGSFVLGQRSDCRTDGGASLPAETDFQRQPGAEFQAVAEPLLLMAIFCYNVAIRQCCLCPEPHRATTFRQWRSCGIARQLHAGRQPAFMYGGTQNAPHEANRNEKAALRAPRRSLLAVGLHGAAAYRCPGHH